MNLNVGIKKGIFENYTPKQVMIAFIMIMLSGNPAITTVYINVDILNISFLIFLVWQLLNEKKDIFERNGFFIFLVFIYIFALQSIFFGIFNIVSIIGFLIKAYIGYAVIRLVPMFPIAYVLIMYRLCILGAIIWFIALTGILSGVIQLFPPWTIYPWVKVVSYALGIHTFFLDLESFKVLRNAGMFWEPGAFAGYINLAFIFMAFFIDDIPRRLLYRIYIVFFIALLTTMSTAGILVFPLALVLSLELKRFSARAKRYIVSSFGVLAFCLMLGGSYIYSNVDFIGEKIEHQLSTVEGTREETLGMNNTRFGTLLFDWFYIKKSPFFGNGLHESTRYRFHGINNRVDGQGNGLSDFVAKFGFIGLIFYVICVGKGLYRFNHNYFKATLSVLVILISLFSEPFLNYPLYIGLFFLYCSPKMKMEYNSV